MAKTEEELKALKNRVEQLQADLTELSEAELDKVTGGMDYIRRHKNPNPGEYELFTVVEPEGVGR